MNGSLNKMLRIDAKGFAVYIIIFMTLMSILAVFSQSVGMLGFITIFGAIAPISSLKKDRMNGWETFERMLPVSPKQIINSKYILTLLVLGMLFLSSVLGHIIGGVICKNANGALELPQPDAVNIMDTHFLKMLCFICLIAVAVAGLLTMMIYRTKNNYLRLGTSFICMIVGMGCSLLVSDDDDLTGPLSEISGTALFITFIIAAALFIASYIFSIRFYNTYKD